MRVASSRPSRNGGWIHRLNDRSPRYVPQWKPLPVADINAQALFDDWQARTLPERLNAFARTLGVSAEALGAVGCAWAAPHGAWAFPMRDGTGRMVGIRLRSEDGRKWAVRGSRQGIFIPSPAPPPVAADVTRLTGHLDVDASAARTSTLDVQCSPPSSQLEKSIPKGCQPVAGASGGGRGLTTGNEPKNTNCTLKGCQNPAPLSYQPSTLNPQLSTNLAYLCEGPTDTAAALSLGLFALGRPSCSGGGVQLREACRRLRVRRAVLVADNDAPGLSGAKRVATEVELPAKIICLPCKDLREYVKCGGTRADIENIVKQQHWRIYGW